MALADTRYPGVVPSDQGCSFPTLWWNWSFWKKGGSRQRAALDGQDPLKSNEVV